MNEDVERVRRLLERSGSSATIRTFDAPVPSAAAAAEQLGCTPGAIANSLVFKVDDRPLLVLASGAHRVDTGRVAGLLGVGKKKVRRADPEFVTKATGQHVGGVAPIGHPAPITTLVDIDLSTYDTVWAGAGDEHSMFSTTASELVALTNGELSEIAVAATGGAGAGEQAGNPR